MATPVVISTGLAVSGVVSGGLSVNMHDPVPRSSCYLKSTRNAKRSATLIIKVRGLRDKMVTK